MKLGILARTAAVVAFAVASGLAFTGTSAAATAELNITYSCTFTLIGAQDMPSKVSATGLPDSATVGTPTGEATTSVVTTVSEQATSVLNWLGAATVEGSMATKILVDNAGTAQEVTSNGTIPKTPIAPTGTFDVTAAGTIPPITLANAGTTTLSLGTVQLTLTPRHADGSTTFLGTFNVPCTVKPGQTTQFHQFPVS